MTHGGRIRPKIVTEEHLTYLDNLRESGETNMFGAPAYIENEFNVSKKEARDITSYWMATAAGRSIESIISLFEERHSNGNN